MIITIPQMKTYLNSFGFRPRVKTRFNRAGNEEKYLSVNIKGKHHFGDYMMDKFAGDEWCVIIVNDERLSLIPRCTVPVF